MAGDFLKVPSFLEGYEELFDENPHSATLKWFEEARYGLFMHYGVYSLLGRGEWAMFFENIPVDEYEGLKDRFTAEDFDADFIADMALEAGMRYVNLTSRHHDSFCLFRTGETDFNAVSACSRDLIGELSKACEQRGLGLFFYYSYALDWRHPYFYSAGENWKFARPAYECPYEGYLYREPGDFAHYLDFVHSQFRELLTQYGPVAGIWLDPIMGYYMRPDLFPIEESYDLIRSLQPQCLISFKQGASGSEDFASCERKAGSLEGRLTGQAAELAARVWRANSGQHNEVCDTMQHNAWGYRAEEDGKHKGSAEVWEMLSSASARNSNLLLNTGPLPGGAIDEQDRTTLVEVGKRIEREGFPGR
jgi:alpha-L-fucosidase